MDIKPEPAPNLAYPIVAAVIAASALSSCQQVQQQSIQGGIRPVEAPALQK